MHLPCSLRTRLPRVTFSAGVRPAADGLSRGRSSVKARWMMAALLASAAALPAHAQPCGTRTGGAPTLTAGQAVRGALAREDMTLPGDRFDGTDPCTGRPHDAYFYEAQAGERLTFVLESTEIDPEITATTHWRGGGPRDVVEQRGRRGRTLTASGTVPATGRILIQVASNVSMGRRGSFGAYTLTVRSNRPAAPNGGGSNGGGSNGAAAGGTALRLGQVVRGELTSADPRLADDSHFEDYTYAARRGERIVATLQSEDFDAFLHVGRAVGPGQLENRVGDDDGGGGTNARAEYTADRDGPVTLRVNTLAAGETGRFTLRVDAAPAPEGGGTPENGSAALPELQRGRAVRGELRAGDARLTDGSFHDDYTYRARRGERLVIRLSSDAFDAVVAAGRVGTGGELENMGMDDDGGGGTNSRLEYTADRDGPVLIRVNSLSAGETGAYTLVVEAGRASAAPSSAPMASARRSAPSLLSVPSRSDARLMAPAARSLATPRLPRPALSNRAQAWGMVALGVGMIVGGLKIEDTAAEPLGALIRYTGYAAILLAPLGS